MTPHDVVLERRRGPFRGRAAVLGVVAGCFLVPVLAPPATAVPLPDQDPFYAVPAGIAGLQNGTIVKARPVDASAYFGLVPMLASAWQVQYKSVDTHFRATAVVATIMVPNAPWSGSGPRPLVSYQTAEDGVGSKCSPSYALRGGGSRRGRELRA